VPQEDIVTAPNLTILAAVRVFETGRPLAPRREAEDAYSVTQSGVWIAAVLRAFTNAVSVLRRGSAVELPPAHVKFAWEA